MTLIKIQGQLGWKRWEQEWYQYVQRPQLAILVQGYQGNKNPTIIMEG